MDVTNKNAFTMLELTFVIVVIGVLAAIAIPKFSATRDDAIISKARATVAAVRNAIATERQKRILRGDFGNPITKLNSTSAVFDIFNADREGVTGRVLEYPVSNCTTLGKSQGCWTMSGTDYRFILPTGGNVDFVITGNRFDCKVPDSYNCRLLTQ